MKKLYFMNNSFEIPITNFRRLIEQDYSDKFQIIFRSSLQEKFFLELSRNEARIISKKINDLCMIDPTIDKYELSTPNNERKQENEDFREILNLIIRSTREQVTIPKDKQSKFTMIQFLLGEKILTDLFVINNIKEAISLLNTEMNSVAVTYLSKHFLELLESGEMKNLNEHILYSIIDEYNESEDENTKEEEKKKIFSILKSQNEEEIAIHFILGIKFDHKGEFFKEVIEYIIEHINDDIVINELPRITVFIRDTLGIKEKVTESKGQITECNFNGDELSGIVSHLKRTLGDDLEENEVLKLSGGGYPQTSDPITNLIQYDGNKISNYYYNYYIKMQSSESESWIEFDFVKRRINLTSYTIRGCCHSSND